MHCTAGELRCTRNLISAKLALSARGLGSAVWGLGWVGKVEHRGRVGVAIRLMRKS